MALSTTTGSGTQTTTQSPQASTGTTGTTESSSSVQPGTATSLLSSQNGMPLHASALTTVNLTGATQAQTSQAAPPSKHHINGGLLGISLALFVIAIALFWFTSRPVKSTT
ncbi:MAG TPA: hypothetical protein VN778_01210 [Verrucomicrobiae bacterium]|nr:hypothetical protein [Verrucomicrobiae bacterium]